MCPVYNAMCSLHCAMCDVYCAIFTICHVCMYVCPCYNVPSALASYLDYGGCFLSVAQCVLFIVQCVMRTVQSSPHVMYMMYVLAIMFLHTSFVLGLWRRMSPRQPSARPSMLVLKEAGVGSSTPNCLGTSAKLYLITNNSEVTLRQIPIHSLSGHLIAHSMWIISCCFSKAQYIP